MSRRTTTAAKRSEPTRYESRQVDEIAAWKSEFPHPLAELFRRALQPLASAVESIVPDRLARGAIEAAYRAADRFADPAEVAREAGVDDLRELKYKPLELCDGLAMGIGSSAQAAAATEGLLTGAGGVWTTLLDIPLLFVLCLRTILKIGRCYGYPLDRPADKAWVLGALAVALSSMPERRADLMRRLREIEGLLIEEAEEQVLIEEAASLLTQVELFADVPVVGAAAGALLNLSAARRTSVTARRLFQERWLKDHGLVDHVEPLVAHGASAHGWSGALTRTAVGIAYGAGFCTAFPVHLAAEGLASIGVFRPRAAA
jgi:hypothetical protein